jgi:predicted DNA-binding protein with PD1-like motif
MIHRLAKPGRTFIGRLAFNDDLLLTLTGFCKNKKIRTGAFSLIGAVQNANLGYYDQKKKRYSGCVALKQKLEIVSCTGNISMKDNEIFVHAHICLADSKGKAFGGHLMPGTRVFAAEFFLQELKGIELVRVKDTVTGLSLWQ